MVDVPLHVQEAAIRVKWSPNSGREDANVLATWVQSLLPVLTVKKDADA